MASRLPALGRRGGGWVVGQAILLCAIALSALVGLGWPGGGWQVLGDALSALLLALGALLLVGGGIELGPALTPFPAPRGATALATGGLYARARHPIYGGAILIAFGWSTYFASVAGVALSILLAIFFELKSRREEDWLTERLPGYAAYRRRVRRRFLPFVY